MCGAAGLFQVLGTWEKPVTCFHMCKIVQDGGTGAEPILERLQRGQHQALWTSKVPFTPERNGIVGRIMRFCLQFQNCNKTCLRWHYFLMVPKMRCDFAATGV